MVINRDAPIAWLQLSAQKPQTLAAIASIAFITIMLFIQLGFRWSFLNATLKLPELLQGDLFLLSRITTTAIYPVPFSHHQLYQTLAFPEVESVTPIYLSRTSISNPAGNPKFLGRVMVVGFPITENPFLIPALDEHLHLLKEVGVVLFDELCHEEHQVIVRSYQKQGPQQVSIVRGDGMTRVTLKGLLPLFGMSNAFYAHTLTSDATFLDIFKRRREEIDIGVIHLKSGVNPKQTQEELRTSLPPTVKVMQKHELLLNEQIRFEFGTPVGLAVRAGLATAVVIGVVVLYQVLFQLTSKYLRDYATMKALGFSHLMLFNIVLTQASTLVVMGYALGVVLSFSLYDYLSSFTGLVYHMTFDSAMIVLLLVSMICLISALLVTRKLREADPADLFG